MYELEPRVTHIAAAREHVARIYQSLNQPHLAIPGKGAQSCQAYVVGTRNADGSFTVWVFLHLIETEEGAVFLSDNRALAADQYAAEEADALSFLESMGFMADDLRFRERPLEEQESLVKTLPCFQKLTGKKKSTEPSKAEKLARLLASF
jgi:hypothetical protein